MGLLATIMRSPLLILRTVHLLRAMSRLDGTRRAGQ
jgi:hypothetical protein